MIPFTQSGLQWDASVKKRFKEIVSFIRDNDFLAFNERDRFLDVGERNSLIEKLEKEFIIDADQTYECDFNESLDTRTMNYDYIFCFEVLEHVMNPAFFMKALREALHDNGKIYLSTPKLALINFYQYEHHFTEYRTEQLERLFEYCGLRVVRKKVYWTFPFWRMFTGVRIFFRTLFYRTQLFELKKI